MNPSDFYEAGSAPRSNAPRPADMVKRHMQQPINETRPWIPMEEQGAKGGDFNRYHSIGVKQQLGG
ncbi:MAG: hypothetical protein GY859_24855 [Desulfobacterales bacterium]|nr:hypothetical protein [Desulfobacterales bacterium]